ncbi:type III secretion system translocon subunit SctE [Burkholderia ubonensis]|uniref:type III secretion system translocon subunit SctE n=1 Tax=Burkholderia ubonensis TaxID=101571 RepID=UPI000754A4EB|nr:type III secretion system translocon subunit SctE [Burkholderia ubonensis]KWN63609.1 secretion protein [Burkholderia ubonensis]
MTVAYNLHGPNASGVRPASPKDDTDDAQHVRFASGLLHGVSVVVDKARHHVNRDGYEPAMAARALVTLKDAAGALNRLLDKFDKVTGTPSAAANVQLRELESLSPDSMMLAVTLLSNKALSDTAELKGKALDIMSAKQEKLRQKEIQEYREQLDKAIEQQEKAKKAGIFGVIFDWIIAAVEVVTGVAKIIGGALTGNASMMAGGAMDVMAGCAGVVKATMNTLALIDPKNASKYQEVADVAGKIQLSFEIAGAIVDVTSAARNMLLTKVIPKATSAVLKEGAEQALTTAIKAGSKDAVKSTAQAVGKEVAGLVSDQILQGIGKTALEVSKKAGKDAVQKTIQQLGVNRMLESFSREAIERTVSKAVEKVASNAIDQGIELSAKELTKAITKQVNRDVMAAALKASTSTILNTTRAVVGGSSQVTAGVLGAERAKLQKEIDQLILDQQWLKMCFDFYAQQKEAQMKDMEELVEQSGQVVEGGSRALKESGIVQAQLAASIV